MTKDTHEMASLPIVKKKTTKRPKLSTSRLLLGKSWFEFLENRKKLGESNVDEEVTGFINIYDRDAHRPQDYVFEDHPGLVDAVSRIEDELRALFEYFPLTTETTSDARIGDKSVFRCELPLNLHGRYLSLVPIFPTRDERMLERAILSRISGEIMRRKKIRDSWKFGKVLDASYDLHVDDTENMSIAPINKNWPRN